MLYGTDRGIVNKILETATLSPLRYTALQNFKTVWLKRKNFMLDKILLNTYT